MFIRTFLSAAALAAVLPALAVQSPRTLTFEQRVSAQRAIEQVYWTHRIWPAENKAPKPPLASFLPDEAIRSRVQDYLRKSKALEVLWRRPITAEQLQAELDRMASHTRDASMLRELFEGLGNDPFLIAETLARPALADRLVRDSYDGDERFEGPKQSFDPWWAQVRAGTAASVEVPSETYSMPAIAPMTACTYDTWTQAVAPPGASYLPSSRSGNTAVWTGAEMIVWGGTHAGSYFDTGGRYDPSTDTWAPTSSAPAAPNRPSGRDGHTAIWTGSEMIVWGGHYVTDQIFDHWINDGGRYDPFTNTWRPMTGASLPAARADHTAVWTGSEMIVWGGHGTSFHPMSSGGVYDPVQDAWRPTSTGANVPSSRDRHTAVWTGSTMIVWGGTPLTNAGGRYDPVNDTWSPMSTTNAPSGRYAHTAVWTGSEMIVWGGFDGANGPTSVYNTGGRYSPSADAWSPTSLGANVPSPGFFHAAAWTGSEMIVWGARNWQGPTNSGGGYDPSSDSWRPISGGPYPMSGTVWTGSQMLSWDGSNTISLYCACPGGALVYADGDGDGFGAGVSTPSCDGSIPPGYVANGSDCDDESGAVWNVPGEATQLTLSKVSPPSPTTQFSWISTPYSGAQGSSIQDFIARAGTPTGFASAQCGAEVPAASSTFVDDGAVPTAGMGFYYLVQPRDACGSGIAGVRSDGGIVTTSCP